MRRVRERTLSRLRSREAWYSEVATVVITLAPAAPIRVPSAPSLEPSRAVVTAASAVAATRLNLRSVARGVMSELRDGCGAVMISGTSAGHGRRLG